MGLRERCQRRVDEHNRPEDNLQGTFDGRSSVGLHGDYSMVCEGANFVGGQRGWVKTMGGGKEETANSVTICT
jgi:hypothetical protein